MACELVTNFEVALIKKLWQCSVLSRTLPRDPCDISIGLSRIPLDNICVWRVFEISGGAKLPLRPKRNRNPNRSKRKNRKPHRILNTKTRLYFSRKPKTKYLNTEYPQTAMNTKTEKPKFFGAKTEKPI